MANNSRTIGQSIIDHWEYKTIDNVGLFIILNTLSCRFKKNTKIGCLACVLPKKSSENKVSHINIKRQVVNLFHMGMDYTHIEEVTISNNGSIFDKNTITFPSLRFIINTCKQNIPNLKKIIFESRIDSKYFDQTLYDLTSVYMLKINIKLEVAIGLEVFNSNLRNIYYKKGLSLLDLEKAVSKILTRNLVKIYLMYRPLPTILMSKEYAINDINNAVKYLNTFANKHKNSISIHINVTYVNNKSFLYNEYLKGNYTPITSEEVNFFLDHLNIYDTLRYYISTNDENLSSLKETREIVNNKQLQDRINLFNLTQKLA